ncbi:LuxR family transcriptional regulator [Saxibacter everestensis]|uniref:LuxR family transcriptional regulator n=1 Tax=Saxibacter everestensis TaxID=2909229 RepID=A0ABY8QTQ4_9MICO|nr:LuxR family transcriptional regulator [Brevibacteriaceae bacterium ZFBP1038]
MPFAGRKDELERILALAAAPREGTLLIEGAAGNGKSALLAEVARRLVPAHTVYLSGGSMGTGPLSGISMLADKLSAARVKNLLVAQLTAPLASAGSAAGGGPTGDAGGDATGNTAGPARSVDEGDAHGSVVAATLRRALRRSELPPTCLLVDDADQLDPDSQAALGYLCRRPQGIGLRMVLAVRQAAPASPFAGLPVIHLNELDLDESTEFATALAGPSADPVTMREVAGVGQRRPQAIREIVGRLGSAQRSGREALTFPLRLGPTTIRHVDSLLAQLSRPARRLLVALSTTHSVDLRIVKRLADAESADLDELLSSDLAIRNGERVEVSSPLVRSAVYWQLPAADRLRMHLTMFNLSRGIAPAAAVWHLSFVHCANGTAHELLDAGISLAGGGLVSAGIESVERALSLRTAVQDLAQPLAQFAQAMFARGEFGYAARYIHFARGMTSNPTARLRLAALTVQLEYTGSQILRREMIEEPVAEYGAMDPDGAASLLFIAANYYASDWDLETSRRLLARAVQFSPVTAQTSLLGQIVNCFVAGLDGDPAPARRMYETLTRDGLADIPDSILIILGHSLSYADCYGMARDIFAVVQSRHYSDISVWARISKYRLAESEVRAGSLHQAEEATSAIVAAPHRQWIYPVLHRMLASWCHQAPGKQEPAVADPAHDLDEETPTATATEFWAHRGRFALQRGDNTEAFQCLSRARQLGGDLPISITLRYLGDLVEVLVSLGRQDVAGQVLRECRTRVGTRPSRPGRLVIARCTALLADGDRSLSLFKAALDSFRPEDSDFDRARTFSCFSRRLLSLGYLAEARKAGSMAQLIYTELGAAGWADHAAALVDAAWETPSDPTRRLLDRLDEAERLIANRAIAGHRNKQIADDLFVSVRTVESKLTTIYRKLGVASRAQLNVLFARQAGRE